MLTNIKKASEEFSVRKSEANDLKEMMGEDHTKFLSVMSQRAKATQSILDLWMRSNIKVLIQQLKT